MKNHLPASTVLASTIIGRCPPILGSTFLIHATTHIPICSSWFVWPQSFAQWICMQIYCEFRSQLLTTIIVLVPTKRPLQLCPSISARCSPTFWINSLQAKQRSPQRLLILNWVPELSLRFLDTPAIAIEQVLSHSLETSSSFARSVLRSPWHGRILC